MENQLPVYLNNTNPLQHSVVVSAATSYHKAGIILYIDKNIGTSDVNSLDIPILSGNFESPEYLVSGGVSQLVSLNPSTSEISFARATGYIQNPQETEDSKINILVQKIINLYETIGRELFASLNYDQLLFMANTAGTIDLGRNVNINRMYGYLNQYGY